MSRTLHPEVSIVLPVFNGAAFLEDSIASCLTQEGPQLELIVVDDGSTDGSQDVVAKYARTDKRVRSLRSTNNHGLPAALNWGCSVASGQLITWTSHDNELRPGALRTLSQYLIEHEDVVVVYSDFSVIDADDRVVRKHHVRAPEELVLKNVVGASFMYRRNIHAEVGWYDPHYTLAEDYEFWLRVFSRRRFAMIREDLYKYREHRDSLSSMQKIEVARAAYRAKKAHSELILRVSRHLRARAYLRLADEALNVDGRLSSFRYLLRSAWEGRTALLGEVLARIPRVICD